MYANRVPKVEVITSQNAPQVIVAPLQQQQQQPVAQLPNFKDDEKMPLFLIKLWSIVEDPQYQQIVRWDEQSSRTTENSTNGGQAQATIQLVMEEMRQLREKQRTTDNKMHELVKENEQLWEQVTLLRAQHNRQQQVVTKLVQFLVAMMQPNSTVAKRVMKRGVLAIDEPPQKRMRMNQNLNSNNTSNLTDILDRLQREMLDIGGIRGVAAAASRADGPIIADVTDEWVPGSSSGSPQGQAQRNKQPFGSNAYNMSSNMQMAPSTSTNNSSTSVGLNTPRRAQNGETPAAISGAAQDFQDYLNGIDLDIDKCRDLLGNHWDFNLFDNVDVDEDQEQVQSDNQQHEVNAVNSSYGGYGMQNGNAQQPGLLTYPGPQLALEGGPLTTDTYRRNPQVELVEEDSHAEVNPQLEFPCTPLVGADDLLFPSTPELLTPCTSPRP
ncbi:HSF-type DNA-binding domain protein [Ostertagia ostertagi]